QDHVIGALAQFQQRFERVVDAAGFQMGAAQGEDQRAIRNAVVFDQQYSRRRQRLHVGVVGAFEKIDEQSAGGRDRVPGGVVDQVWFFPHFEAQGSHAAAPLSSGVPVSRAR